MEFGRDYPRDIMHKLYNVEGTIIAHVKIPSRKKQKVTYDVCIAIMGTLPQDAKTEPGFLEFRAFSNSPSFYFRCARQYRSLNAFIDFLAGKYDKKVWSEPLKKSEMPTELPFERTIYTALFYLQKKQLLSFPYDNLRRKASNISQAGFANRIQSASKVEDIYDTSRDTDQEKARKSNVEGRKQFKADAKAGRAPSQLAMKQVGNTVKFTRVSSSSKRHKVGRSKKVSKF